MMVVRRQRIRPRRPDEAWSLDFVADQLADGRKFRALTVVDVFTREALAIEVGSRLRGEHVVATLDRIALQRRKPHYLFVDNGSEFSGRFSIFGRITTRYASTSAAPVDRPTTATWKPSMDRCAMNA
jgi:transposase InsO family protein